MTQIPAHVTPAPHSPQQLTAITDTIALAFAHDPSWSPILSPNADDLAVARSYWGLFVNTAQRYPFTFTVASEAKADTDTAEVAAAAVWYPPNAEELTHAEEEAFPEFVAGLIGEAKRDEVLAISDLFDAAHPTAPHYYLSLLATHPAHSGKGLGMGLLAANLAEFDKLGVPTYLESSNPANNARYQRLGYEPHGTIDLPSGLTIMTMWREPQAI
ncbi:GNAT superfamily N-acetyltransferase [Leucobacter exalbidus]|uniref:GNAT superfamily N-acetyltransferase n=1 Tax=Leucobacter exalbidus TaxID=662960 RepID=A0A940T566_9MICO|nr:GNAT family N-acetyltransferase [Leucobacter exalbidus]MBP1325681.1 GNAT superfamily N-acetyltransferase [Leucobacter exalbidus]